MFGLYRLSFGLLPVFVVGSALYSIHIIGIWDAKIIVETVVRWQVVYFVA